MYIYMYTTAKSEQISFKGHVQKMGENLQNQAIKGNYEIFH